MGRIRTIKPEFTQDEELSSLPAETHLLAAGLLCYSDDDGFFNANHGLVKASVFPLRETSVSIHEMLTQLSGIGFIRLGIAADGKHYGHVKKFTEHQRVNRPTPSKIKGLDIRWNESVSTQGGLNEDSLGERNGMEWKGKEENHNHTATPKASPVNGSNRRGTRIPENFAVTQQHRQFAQENRLPAPELHIAEFVDYWRAQPGSRGVKLDWDATFRNWLRRSAEMKPYGKADAPKVPAITVSAVDNTLALLKGGV